MTPTTPPSEPRRRLAAGLRGLRIDADLSTTELAKRLGWSQSKVSKTELGRTLPSPADVEEWARVTGAERPQLEELVQIAVDTANEATEWRRELAPGRRRKQQEIQRMEAGASVIRVFSHDVIPGLAQTRPYIAAMFRLGRDVGLSESDLEVIDARIARQAVLDDRGKRFHFVMSETALWRALIPSDEMRQQLERLIELSTRENVTVGVIPFRVPERVHQYHGFSIIGDPAADGAAIVLTETVTRGLSIRSATEVAEYVAHFEALRQGAVEGDELRDLIREVIGQAPGS